MDDKKPEETPPKRVTTKATPPISPRIGGNHTWTPAPKPISLPGDVPPYYPNELVLQTVAVLTEARKKYQLDSQMLEFCKETVSKLTHPFSEAVRLGWVRGDLAQSRMSDLISSILRYNYGGALEAVRIEEETRHSDEWMTLINALLDASRPPLSDPPAKFALNDEGRLIDLAAWRREFPGESFRELLNELKMEVYEAMRDWTAEQVNDCLSYHLMERTAILSAYPELEEIEYDDPSQPEEQEFLLCEAVLQMLRLQLARGSKQLARAADLNAPTGQESARHPIAENEDPRRSSEQQTLPPEPESRPLQPSPDFEANSDYRSIVWRGKSCTLTRAQSLVIEVLHDAYNRGLPDVGKD